MAFTSYSIENDRIFQEALKNAKDAVGDLTVPLRQIAGDFYKSQNAIFDPDRTGPGQYPDLSEKYKKEKKASVGFAYPILLRTGRLRNSVTGLGMKPNSSEGSAKVIDKSELELKTTVPYAEKHQEGIGVPMRKMFFIGPEAIRFANNDQMGRLQRWTDILKGYVDQKVGSK